jgi:type II secretory pathway pseudopilin PulG
MRASTKAKQSEAKQLLKQIYTMQQAYRQEKDTYWGNGVTASAAAPTAFATIGVEIGPTARYAYTLAVPGASTFTCEASASVLDDDATFDVWQIDQTGSLVPLTDDAVS